MSHASSRSWRDEQVVLPPRRSAPLPKAAPLRLPKLPLFLGGLGLFLFALLQVWVRLQFLQMGYALSAAAQENKRLAEENRRLVQQQAHLSAISRIQQFAQGQLHLAPPTQIHELRGSSRTAPPGTSP